MTSLFKKNLSLFNAQNPSDPLIIPPLKENTLHWPHPDKEQNLIFKENGEEYYLYHPEGGSVESKDFIQLIPLESCHLLMIFGVGLGCLFDELEPWLKENPTSHLVFIEDNMTIFSAFLHTQRASIILAHAQTKVIFLQDETLKDDLFHQLLKSVLIPPGYLSGIHFAALPSYRQVYFKKIKNLYSILIKEIEKIERMGERRFFSETVLSNHMKNLFFYPESYHINSLFNGLKDIPVIVCGGGSSLEDHIDFLKQVEGCALIVGVGAGSNILAENAIHMHLTFGLDPTYRHSARLAGQACYEVPLIYASRMHHLGLEWIQSPLILAPIEEEGAHAWINKQLKIQKIDTFNGASVGNFATTLLQSMGCSPILFLGIDLSHTKNQLYASGWQDHPLIATLKECHATDLRQSIFQILDQKEEDSPSLTTYQFLLERHFYTLLSQQYPETAFFNLSPTGMEIPGVPYLLKEEALDRFFHRSFDLQGHIHSLIFQAPLFSYRVTKEKIREQMRKWNEHLDHGYTWCQRIADRLQEECMIDENRTIDPKEIIKFEKKINKSPVYEHLLKEYELSFEECHETQVKWWGKKISEARKWIDCYRHLANCTALALTMMESIRTKNRLNEQTRLYRSDVKNWDFGLAKAPGFDIQPSPPYYNMEAKVEFESRERSFNPKSNSSHHFGIEPFMILKDGVKENVNKRNIYQLSETELTLIDWDLDLSYQEPHDQPALFSFEISSYPSGQLKSKSGRYSGSLHGYSIFYSENEEILSIAWFIKGVKQGKALRYYASGAIYCIERYRDGLREHNQEFFFENGSLRTILPYLKGQLHGCVRFYHRNGIKKREIPYIHNKRCGIERRWDENGTLRGHIKYDNNQPFGTAGAWFADGSQQLEISYLSPGIVDYIDQWDESGTHTHKQDIPEESAIRAIEEMTQKIKRMQNEFQTLVHQLPSDEELGKLENNADIQGDLLKLNEEMKKFEKFFKRQDI